MVVKLNPLQKGTYDPNSHTLTANISPCLEALRTEQTSIEMIWLAVHVTMSTVLSYMAMKRSSTIKCLTMAM